MALVKLPSRNFTERGAAAVEFALIVPLLMVLLAGIVDFGRAFYTEIVLTNAAREGARALAMNNTISDVGTRVQVASGGKGKIQPALAPCVTGTDAKVTVVPADPFTWIFLDDILKIIPGGTGLANPDLSATGVMRCNG